MKLNLKKLLISHSPSRLQKKIIQDNIEIPLEFDASLEIKIAETYEEFESAYHLLYSSYIEIGYEKPNDSRLRVITQHMLPTTTTLVAKLNGEVVGSMSIVKDNSLGLPSERVFNIDDVRAKNPNIAEISSLAVRKDVRRHKGGQVFFPLLKYMYEYCVKFADIEELIISVRPHAAYFYEGLMFFKKISDTKEFYPGIDVVSLKLNLAEALTSFKKIYGDKPIEKNLYHFFVEREISALKFPERKYHQLTDSTISKEIMSAFFLKRAKMAEKMTVSEYFKVKNSYKNTSIFSAFTEFENTLHHNDRKYYRSDVKMQATVNLPLHATDFDAQAISVSRSGVRLNVKSIIPSLSKSETVVIKVSLGPGITTDLKARLAWRTPKQMGFEIISAQGEWYAMIDELSQTQLHMKAA